MALVTYRPGDMLRLLLSLAPALGSEPPDGTDRHHADQERPAEAAWAAEMERRAKLNEQERFRAEEVAALRGEMFEDSLALDFPTRQSVGLDPATPQDMAAEFAADNMSAEAFALEIDRIINGGA